MKRKHFGLVALVACMAAFFALAADVTAEGGRFTRGKKTGAKKAQNNQPFSVSGVYTGGIGGEMTISGRKVWVSDKALVWMVSEGQGKLGTFVTKRRVYAAGIITDGVPVVNQVLIRPSSSTRMVSMSSGSRTTTMGRPPVGEVPDNAPR